MTGRFVLRALADEIQMQSAAAGDRAHDRRNNNERGQP